LAGRISASHDSGALQTLISPSFPYNPRSDFVERVFFFFLAAGMARFFFELSARLWDLSAFDRFSDMSNSFPQLGFSRYPGGLKLRPVPADNLVLIASFTKKLHAMHDRVRSGQHHR
jgi:hypothetical protein